MVVAETREADVVVVGAGPGGSSAAYHLARHGLTVLLLEKTEFPREKVCGDGLTPRAVRQLVRMGIAGCTTRACAFSAAGCAWSWTGRTWPASPTTG